MSLGTKRVREECHHPCLGVIRERAVAESGSEADRSHRGTAPARKPLGVVKGSFSPVDERRRTAWARRFGHP